MEDSRFDRVVGLIAEARDVIDELRADDSVPWLDKFGMQSARKSLHNAMFDLTNVRRHLNEAHRRAVNTIKDSDDRHA